MENCLFINLEHRKDRLDSVQRQLGQLGIVGTRVNAVKTKQGFIGCTLSHIKCLEIAKEKNFDRVFICEDDIVFKNPKLLNENLNQFLNSGIYWDVIIIGGNNFPPFQIVNSYCIKVNCCQTTTGYIVNKHYYDKLIQNFREGVDLLMKHPYSKEKYSIDIYWMKLQKADNWYMIIPPTVTQKSSFSDIENRNTNYSSFMLDYEKKWMFNK